MLTGKYTRADLTTTTPTATATRKNLAAAAGRSPNAASASPTSSGRSPARLGRTPAQVALAWTLLNPAVTAPIIGARTLVQLEDNLGALEVDLHRRPAAPTLEKASAIELGFPHDLLTRPRTRGHVFDGTRLEHHT